MADNTSDALWLSILAGLTFLIYLDHLQHAARLWLRERSARSFRNLFIAVMLQVGLLRIWLGATVRAAPDHGELVTLQNIVAPLLTLMILSGGFLLLWTWRRPWR